jgi:hypothetical protein
MDFIIGIVLIAAFALIGWFLRAITIRKLAAFDKKQGH